MSNRCILLCTVGGSHQPVVTAIAHLKPDYVVFFCSEDDLATGRKGSYTQVEGAGNCIKASPEEHRPTLPNIPTQAALEPARYEVQRVPADDLDAASERMRMRIAELAAAADTPRMFADYTGGTKTMTAALVIAALGFENVELQLITGSRSDLVKVHDGGERPAPAAVEGLRLAQALSLHLGAWRAYGYGVAANGLDLIASPRSASLRAKLHRARDLSRGFDAWDRFDHVTALRIMAPYGSVIGNSIPTHIAALRILAGMETPQREGLRIWDLWLNALRRGETGRYDDAVGRIYRVLEWTAQWILRARAGLNTADLPANLAQAAGVTAISREGKHQAGLYAAWQLVEQYAGDPAAQFFKDEGGRLLRHLSARNMSILAHGYTPVNASMWSDLKAWLESAFIPVLRHEIAAAGLKDAFPQLPNIYLWDATAK